MTSFGPTLASLSMASTASGGVEQRRRPATVVPGPARLPGRSPRWWRQRYTTEPPEQSIGIEWRSSLLLLHQYLRWDVSGGCCASIVSRRNAGFTASSNRRYDARSMSGSDPPTPTTRRSAELLRPSRVMRNAVDLKTRGRVMGHHRAQQIVLLGCGQEHPSADVLPTDTECCSQRPLVSSGNGPERTRGDRWVSRVARKSRWSDEARPRPADAVSQNLIDDFPAGDPAIAPERAATIPTIRPSAPSCRTTPARAQSSYKLASVLDNSSSHCGFLRMKSSKIWQ